MTEVNPMSQLKTRSYLQGEQTPKPFDISSFQPATPSPARFDISNVKSPPPEQDLFDVTIGAAEFGAADVGRLLFKNVGTTLGSDYITSVANDLQQFQNDHPQYAPTEVKNTFDLITDPKAISSRVFGAAPYLLATAGAELLPGGIALAPALIYGIESQRAYDQAKTDGASETEANTSARISGVVNTIFQSGKALGLIKFARGAEDQVVSSVISDAAKMVNASGAIGNSINFVAKQGVIGALQGASSELIPLGVYAKPVEGGFADFLDRRLQDAFGAVATAAVFGPLGKAIKGVVGKDGTMQPSLNDGEQGKVLDAFDQTSLSRTLQISRGLEAPLADATAAVVNARAVRWAQENGATPEQYYATHNLVDLAKSESPVQGPLKNPSKEGSPPEVLSPTTASGDLLTSGEGTLKALKVDMGGTSELSSTIPEFNSQDLLDKARENVGQGTRTKKVDDYLFSAVFTDEGLARILGTTTDAVKPLVDNGMVKKVKGGYQLDKDTFIPSKADLSIPESTAQKPSLLGGGEEVKGVLGDLFKLFKSDLSPDKLAEIQDIYPQKKSAKGQRSSDEQMSQAFERYLRTGSAPQSELVEPFEAFSGWIKDTWGSVRDQGLNTTLKPEAVRLFDNLFRQDTPTINLMSQNVDFLKQKITEVSKGGGEIGPYKEELQRTQVQLQKLKDAQFNPREPTEVDNAARAAQESLKNATPLQKNYRSLWQRAVDTVGSWISLKTPLVRYENGKELYDGLNNVRARHLLNLGWGEDKIVEANALLTSKERDFLSQSDASGNTNLDKLFDIPTQNSFAQPGGQNLDPSKMSVGIQRAGQLLFDINRKGADLATEIGVYQKGPNDEVVPFEQPEGQRVPRILKAEARQAIVKESGPLYDAIVKAVAANNGLSIKATIDGLRGDYASTDVRRSSSLEYVRKIKNLPAVVDLNGTPTAIRETRFIDLARRSLEAQSMRVEMIREFGQGDILEEVGRGKLKQLLDITGVDYKETREKLLDALQDKLGHIDLNMPWKDVKALARDPSVNINLGWSREKMLDSVVQTPPSDLGIRQQAQLRSFAKEVGGVSLMEKGPDGTYGPRNITDLFNDLKTRLTKPIDNRLQRLADGYVQEGGDSKDFQRVLRVAQGLPYGWLEKGLVNDSVKFGSEVIGSMQTSLAAIPNLPQTLTQVPALTGGLNYLKGVEAYLKSPEATKSTITALTGMARSVFVLQGEPGYKLATVGRVLREAAGRLTLQDQVNDFNRYGTGEAFRQLALQWKGGDFDPKDIPSARRLGLNQKEIESLVGGKGMDDITFAKIVQNGVGKTQYNTDAPYNKGLVENIPLARMLLSYSSYLFGTTRQNLTLLNELGSAVKNKDLPGIGEGFRKLSYTLVGMVGAGMVSQMLRAAVKGKGSDEVEELSKPLLDQTLGALHEVGGLGILNRFSDAFKYDGGIPERTALSIVPQVGAIVKMMGVLAGYGRFGEFPLTERVGQELKREVPLAGSGATWFDDLAWPEHKQYEIVRNDVSAFKKTLPNAVQENFSTDEPMRPDYYSVFNYVSRGDLGGAQDAAKSYYQSLVMKKEDLETGVRGLRGSLQGRSPMNLSDPLELRFLQFLPPEKRGKFLQAQLKYQSLVDAVAPRIG